MLPIAVYNILYFACNLASKLEKNIKNLKKSLSYTDREINEKNKKSLYFRKISIEIHILKKNYAFWSVFVDFMSFLIFQLNNKEMPKICKYLLRALKKKPTTQKLFNITQKKIQNLRIIDKCLKSQKRVAACLVVFEIFTNVHRHGPKGPPPPPRSG